jgi:hypothetical protein
MKRHVVLCAVLLMTVGAVPSKAAVASGLRVSVSASADSSRAVRVKVVLTGRSSVPRSRWTLTLQRRVGIRWSRLTSVRSPRTTSTLRAKAPGTASGITMRVIATSRGRQLAASRAVLIAIPPKRTPPTVPGAPVAGASGPATAGPALPTPVPTPTPATPTSPSDDPPPTQDPPPDSPTPPSDDDISYTVPATTQLYGSNAITAVDAPTEEDGTVAVDVLPPDDAHRAVPGGHVALGRAPGLPYGMFAAVDGVADLPNGEQRLQLSTAAIDEVLDDVDYRFDDNVVPRVVDAEGDDVPGGIDGSGDVVLRGDADFTGRAATSSSAFVCKTKANLPQSPEDAWQETGLPFPIDVKLENPHVIHNFDSGSLFPARAPSLLLQFSGEAVASIGFEAKTAFTCQLSDAYRRNHRIVLPLKNLGPVPVSAYLEPTLKFSVSASGKIGFSQRRYFALTFDKHGSDPLDARIATSVDPLKLDLGARLNASFFAGGDLTFLVGAAGKSTSIGAGVYGDFGPELELSTASQDPGCVDFIAHLRAEVGLRLQLWKKSWSLELGSLTSPDVHIAGAPFCGLPDPPTPSSPLRGEAISAGVVNTCAVVGDGQVACWGMNSARDPDDATYPTPRPDPTFVPGVDDAVAVSARSGAHLANHSCALLAGGGVKCWGEGRVGELGNGAFDASVSAVSVTALPDATSVAVGGHNRFSCATRTSGQVVCWGTSTGPPSEEWGFDPSPTPVLVHGVTDAAKVIVGLNVNNACALRTDGTVWCWYNGSTILPAQIDGLDDVVDLSVSSTHSCAVRADGHVQCWGYDTDGELGDGEAGEIYTTVPTTVQDLDDAEAVTAGIGFTCALEYDRHVLCWGAGTAGQLGDDTTTPSARPVQVLGLDDAVSISSGDQHACARRQTGTMVCWGANQYGQLGNGSTTSSAVPVTVKAPVD